MLLFQRMGLGVKRVVFHKSLGLSLHARGVKSRTFTQLRNSRAGVEGSISELKRTVGATTANWKGLDGFNLESAVDRYEQ